jgi:translation initiation factor IF-3
MNITLIGEDGKLVGNVSLEQARSMAKASGKDLIMINAKSNIYRIADAGKLKYEQKQKERQQRAQKRTHKVKEIQLSPNIDINDLNTKISHAREFLNKGFKTKITMMLKGRQVVFGDLAMEKLEKFISTLINEGIATVDGQVKQDGRDIIAYLISK